MALAYIGLGTNMGNRRQNLTMAAAYLAERAGEITALSGIYETEPQGFSSDQLFLNAVMALETELSPQELLALTQSIEQEMGRTEKSVNHQYKDRIIDLDILAYDDLILNAPELMLPHPLMQERLFVLEPFSEIAPGYIHPLLNETIQALYHRLKGAMRQE